MKTTSLHVCVIANTAWYLYNFRLNLMVALQRAGYTILAVAPEDEYADRIRASGIVFEAVPISGGGVNPMVELGSVLRLRALLRRKRVNLVLSYTPKGNLYSALASLSASIPFVPNVSGLGRAFGRRSMVTWIVQMLYRLTFPRARYVFFQNNEDMAIFINSGLARSSQSDRLPGSGVDLTRFEPAPPTGHSAGALVFLLVARMLWEKGVGEFVKAARSVREVYPNTAFHILGFVDKNNPSAISQMQLNTWTQEGAVAYLGETDNVRPFVAASDCSVLPSFYREGVPRVLLEAAAMGRPIITTATAGCQDTVIDGVTGFLCKPEDSADLADKMLAFLALDCNQRVEMGTTGRDFIARNFDERIVVEKYLKIVHLVAAELSGVLPETLKIPRPSDNK